MKRKREQTARFRFGSLLSFFSFFCNKVDAVLLSDKRNRHHYGIGKGGAGHLGIGAVDGIYSLA